MDRRSFIAALAGATVGRLFGFPMSASQSGAYLRDLVAQARCELEMSFKSSRVSFDTPLMSASSFLHLYTAGLVHPFRADSRSTVEARTQEVERLLAETPTTLVLETCGGIEYATLAANGTHRGQITMFLHDLTDRGLIRDVTVGRTSQRTYGLEDLSLGHAHKLADDGSSWFTLLDSAAWNLRNIASLSRETEIALDKDEYGIVVRTEGNTWFVRRDSGEALHTARLGSLLDRIHNDIYAAAERDKTEWLTHGAAGYAAYSHWQPNRNTPAEMQGLYRLLVAGLQSTSDSVQSVGHFLESIATVAELHGIDVRPESQLLSGATSYVANVLIDEKRESGIEGYTHALMGAERISRLLG